MGKGEERGRKGGGKRSGRLPATERLEAEKGPEEERFGRGKVTAKGPRKRQEIKVWRAVQPLAAGAIEATRPHAVQPCTNTDQRQRVRAPFDHGDKGRQRKRESSTNPRSPRAS